MTITRTIILIYIAPLKTPASRKSSITKTGQLKELKSINPTFCGKTKGQMKVCLQTWALRRDPQGAHQHASFSIDQLSTDACLISIAASQK